MTVPTTTSPATSPDLRGLDEQRLEVRRARTELVRGYRSRLTPSADPPIRVMARLVTELERECAERGYDPAATRLEIVNRTIGDVNLRLVTECDGEEGGPRDFRLLADELGIAVPGEVVAGRAATGEVYRWLREQMAQAELALVAEGYDPRVYDISGIGNPVLRGWLAQDMERWGLAADARHVTLGLGATDCLDKVLRGLAARARREGRTPGAVLFAAPGFNMPELQAVAYGIRLHRVVTGAEDRFKLTAELLAQHLEANPDIDAVYLAVTNNPTTFAYTPAELTAVNEVLGGLAERGRGVHLMADLAYVGTGAPADDEARMRALTGDPRVIDRLILVSSLSKTHTLTGERFGWVTFGDPRLAREMSASWVNGIACLPGEWQLRFMAYHTLFRENPGLIVKIRDLYHLRRSRLRSQLERLDQEYGVFEHVHLDDDATIYNWSRLRAGEDCFSVLEKTGVAGIPGSTFGYSDDYIRFSVGMLPVATD